MDIHNFQIVMNAGEILMKVKTVKYAIKAMNCYKIVFLVLEIIN